MSRARNAVLIVLLAGLGVAARELRLSAVEHYRGSQRYEDIYYLPPPNWLPVLSLGFHAAAADLIWCRSLVYFGEELVQRGAIKYAFDYTDAILALDPDFRSAYEWIATAALYKSADVSLKEGLRAASYVKRALARWPNNGQLHWRYGSVLRFELAPLMKPGPEKERLIAQATPHLATAASLGAGPPWLALNSAGLMQRLGKTEQAIRHLEEVYGTVQDEFTKRAIEERLAELRSQTFVEALKTANLAFEQSRLASYPYLSPGLFLLVGERFTAQWPDLVAHHFLSSTEVLGEEPEEAALE